MNKCSLLVFSVIGLLLSTISELNFVDGRLECCDHSSRPLLSDTRLSIYETDCPYRTFTEISQLISLKREIRYDARNVEIKRLSRSDGRRLQFESRRTSSYERFRVSNNVVFVLDDSTSSTTRDRKIPGENNDLYLRKNLKSFSSDNFRENHVYRSRSRNNDFLKRKMERNTQERRINIEEELSEIRDNHFHHNDRNQERFNRRTFNIKTYIIPNQRENVDRTMLSFIHKNEGKRDGREMERNNLEITTRQRLFRDTRLTSDLSRNTDRRFKNDNRNSNERHVTMQLVSKIGILRNGNIRDYLRSSPRDDGFVKMYKRQSLINVRRNIDMNGTINVYRRSSDEDISEEMVPGASSRSRTMQRENEGSRNRIRDDKKQMDNRFEKKFFKERYLTRGLSRQNSNFNRLQEVRMERASDQSKNRKVRENNREVKLSDENTAERITPRNKNSLVEKQEVSSNINRRSEANRRSVEGAREKEKSRFWLNRENENIFEQSRIRQIRNTHNENMLRDSRNSRENRKQEDSKFNKRLVSNTNRNVEKKLSRTYNEKSDREEFRNSLVRQAERAFDESRIMQVRDNPEHRREYQSNVERAVERVLTRIDRNTNNVAERGFLSIRSSIGNNRLNGIIRNAGTVLKHRENYEARYWSAHENKRVVDHRRTRDMLEDREDNLSNERLAQRNLASRSSTNNDVLNNNRRSYNDENNPQVILTTNRSERERYSSANRRSSYLRTIQPEHENRMHNDYRQRTNIQEIRCLAREDSDINRIVEDRRAKTPNEKLYTRNILASENKRSFDNSRISQQRDSREYRLNEKVSVRNIDKINERRDSRIRSEIDVNHQNQRTKRTLILLQLRDKNVPSLMRLNERNIEQIENRIVRNKQFTRIEGHSRDIRIAQIHELRKKNVRSNARATHDNVITKHVETEVEFHNSDEAHHERRTERVIRHIDRHGLSINNRDVNRKLEYIRHVRSYNGPENSAHRENKNNARTSDRENNRRDIRGNNLQILNKESRITKTRRTNEEREIRTAFTNIQFLPIEHKTQSDNQIFKINLQYIIYILQGLYIIGLLTKFTENYKGIQKRTRFSNWFPLFSTLKVH